MASEHRAGGREGTETSLRKSTEILSEDIKLFNYISWYVGV